MFSLLPCNSSLQIPVLRCISAFLLDCINFCQLCIQLRFIPFRPNDKIKRQRPSCHRRVNDFLVLTKSTLCTVCSKKSILQILTGEGHTICGIPRHPKNKPCLRHDLIHGWVATARSARALSECTCTVLK